MKRSESSDAQVVATLRLAVTRLSRRLRQQSADPVVTPTLLSALSTIDKQGEVSLGRLAALESVQPPSITRVVVRLEELGYVVREVDSNDRRSVQVSLTETGRERLLRARSAHTAYLAERVAELSAEERKILRLVAPILERLSEDEPDEVGGR